MPSPLRPDPGNAAQELAALRPALRLAVHRLRQQNRGRLFPWLLHVGGLDGDDRSFSVTDPGRVDAGLRLDLCFALLGHCEEPGALIWITRPGDVEVTATDLAWLQSAWGASRDLGRPLSPALVVTKSGWAAPFSGEQMQWQRLRIRSRVVPSQPDQACTGSLECINSR
ncbi:hypothetical protein ACLM5J_16505 [Nocardioides sp. Bht2]|uniref:hypothetical protein n=1 Tax=Nocardioides sp. Bht2 TaxID=3392297 RepID=UPI0039B398DE